MMEKDALEYLAQLLSIDQPTTDYPGVVTPKDMGLLSLEALQAAPNMMKATFRSWLIESFADYVEQAVSSSSKSVFIDTERMSAHAVLDHGEDTPGWCAYNAFLCLKKLEDFNQLILRDGERYRPLDLVDFLIDYENNILFFDADDKELPAAGVIAAMRNLQVFQSADLQIEDGDFTQSSTDLERISVESMSPNKLPAYFNFTCQPYAELSAQIFLCRFRVFIENKTPYFRLRIEALNAIKQRMAEEFKERITDRLTDIQTYFGDFEHHYPQIKDIPTPLS